MRNAGIARERRERRERVGVVAAGGRGARWALVEDGTYGTNETYGSAHISPMSPIWSHPEAAPTVNPYL